MTLRTAPLPPERPSNGLALPPLRLRRAGAQMLIVSLPLLAGCVQAPTQEEVLPVVTSCDCDAPETDEGTIARTGFPLGVVWAEHADFREGGQVLRSVQFELAKATMAQIGAAPEKICGFHGETLLSSQVRDPDPDDRDLPGTVVLEALCQA